MEDLSADVARLRAEADRCDNHACSANDEEIKRSFEKMAIELRSLADGIVVLMRKQMH